jgi:hypothetical protein
MEGMGGSGWRNRDGVKADFGLSVIASRHAPLSFRGGSHEPSPESIYTTYQRKSEQRCASSCIVSGYGFRALLRSPGMTAEMAI